MSLYNLQKELRLVGDSDQKKILSRFFKTGPGEYAEGDVFLGIKVPIQRKIAKKYYGLSIFELQNLLDSNIHEFRFTALVIMIEKFKKISENKIIEQKVKDKQLKEIFDFYLHNLININNWDLVDISSPNIVGAFLLEYGQYDSVLYKLAESNHLWSRRVGIVSTFKFIREQQFDHAVAISKIILKNDVDFEGGEHVLNHKAVGWMLREVGKRDINVLKNFLDQYAAVMPRVMLRNSLEKFDTEMRKYYLNLKK